MNETILNFFQACQPFGYPLLACSVILLSAIFHHLLFSSDRRLLSRLQRAVDERAANGDAPLREVCRRSHSALAAAALYALDHRGDPTAEKHVEAKLQAYMDAERAGMATISVITNIAPMLGILGTAWGLVDIFGVFGTPGAEAGIALGISKALYTTIFGLAIAVPGIIALTCFERGLERRAAVLNALFTDIQDTTPSK